MTVDDLVQVRETVAAVQLIVAGKFEKELKEIAEKKAELTKMYGVIPELDAAKKAHGLAEGLLVAQKTKSAEHEEHMKKEKAALAADRKATQEAELRAKDKAADSVLAVRRAEQALHDNNQAVSARMVELSQREEAVRERELQVTAQETELKARINKVREAALA